MRQTTTALLLLHALAACGGEDLCETAPIDVVPWSGGTVTSTNFECSEFFVLCRPEVTAFTHRDSCDPPNSVRVQLTPPIETDAVVELRLDYDRPRWLIGASAAYLTNEAIHAPTSGTISIEGNRIASDCIRGRLTLTFDSVLVEGEFVSSCGAAP